ncbi:uncharacterized protein LOC141648081 isoform X1 [Silene latifolia]|uniref:uncharacterized protein LOC141648081 isoform X1 n=2 Tax=Silene latifolia TaxID=37657 RepID=UPI003D772707
MGAYHSCCSKRDSIASLDVRPKKRIRPSLTNKTSSISSNYWTSICEMENSAVKSQGSISSVQALNTQASVSSSDPPSEFVNLGLNHWNQTRQDWVSSKNETSKGQQTRDSKLRNRRFSVLDSLWPFSWKTTTYESLLGSNKAFSQPVPLAEMVDFLVDVWEQEGMYD